MAIHHFTLIVDGPDLQEEALIEALFDAGCDDGLVGRSEGNQYIEFDREAPDLEVAMLSAVADVEKAPGVKVARIADAGLVSMARDRCAHRAYPRGGAAPGQGLTRPRRVPSSRYGSPQSGTDSGVGPK